jgi:hypothetical protein
MALTIRNVVTVIKGRNYSNFNLHRWGNHFNNECTERIEQCMSIQWNDYSCLSLDEQFLKKKNKEIDDVHGEQIQRHLQQIKRSQNKIQQPQQQEPRITIVKETKSAYSYYLDTIDMRATMMF